ncbi:hypothetical protein [Mesorhizobium sangaii]|uniref:hypothetical protein n=1 Tax=Mesorhizobium sangaii TaxID=505389 RepID=UPI0031B5EF8B
MQVGQFALDDERNLPGGLAGVLLEAGPLMHSILDQQIGREEPDGYYRGRDQTKKVRSS